MLCGGEHPMWRRNRYSKLERQWLKENQHYRIGGRHIFPNGAHPVTKEDIEAFALLGRKDLGHMEGKVLGVTPQAYASYKYAGGQSFGADDLDTLITFISGIHLGESDFLQPF